MARKEMPVAGLVFLGLERRWKCKGQQCASHSGQFTASPLQREIHSNTQPIISLDWKHALPRRTEPQRSSWCYRLADLSIAGVAALLSVTTQDASSQG